MVRPPATLPDRGDIPPVDTASVTVETATGPLTAIKAMAVIDVAAANPTLTALDVGGAFDAVAVGQPSLAWIEESTGRGLWLMWFAGTDMPPPVDDTPPEPCQRERYASSGGPSHGATRSGREAARRAAGDGDGRNTIRR